MATCVICGSFAPETNALSPSLPDKYACTACLAAARGVISKSVLKQLNAEYLESHLASISDISVKHYISSLLDAHYGRSDIMPDEDTILSEPNSGEITLCGSSDTVWTLQGNNLIINKKKKEAMIPLSCIIEVIHKPSRGIKSGMITVHTAKAPSGFVNIGFGVAVGDNNGEFIFYMPEHLETADRVVKYIMDSISGRLTPQQAVNAAPAEADPIERISKLKGLLDSGAITQEEFAALKAKLISEL